jgi:hypothetical protein
MRAADERLAAAADRHLTNNPEGQLVELLLTWIDEDRPAWLSTEVQRQLWPTEMRFEWLLARPDVRARVVTTLTGLSDGAARRLDPDVQIALVDAVVDNDDVTTDQWAAAFAPKELAAHAPPGAMHALIRERFPWQAPPSDDSRNFLFAWMEAVLSPGDGNGRSREPILTPLAFRSAIDPEAWQASVPLEVRASVDALRLDAERRGHTFGANEELSVVSLETLIEHMPHPALHPVLEAAERALHQELDGFVEALRSDEVEAEESLAVSADDEPEATEAFDGDDEVLPPMDITRTDHLTEEAPRP